MIYIFYCLALLRAAQTRWLRYRPPYRGGLNGCGTALKVAPPAAARETLPIVSTKLDSTMQCETLRVLSITGPPIMSKSWLIRGAAQYLGKMKEETVGEKRGPANSVNYLPHWQRSRASLGKGRPTYA